MADAPGALAQGTIAAIDYILAQQARDKWLARPTAGGLGACGAAQVGRACAVQSRWVLAEVSARACRHLERRGPTRSLLVAQ